MNFKIISIFFLLGLNVQVASAKGIEIAYYDLMKVVDSTPTWINANLQIDDFIEIGLKTIADMKQQYSLDSSKFYSLKNSLSEIEVQTGEEGLLLQKNVIANKMITLEEELQILNESLLGPMEKSLARAIINVSQAYGLTIIYELHELLEGQQEKGVDFSKQIRWHFINIEKERTGM